MWFQLKIEQCPSNQVEEISDELEEYGALSVMLTDKYDNPVLEPAPGTTPLWPEVQIHALYAQATDAQFAKEQLERNWPTLAYSLEVLEEKDWERAWMDDFKPQRFGKRLWVCPTWLTPPEPEAVNLMLDPGLAFGTGTHATTALCLTWLEQAELKDKTVIDYGCGSGILSIAALKLGAKKVYAVDIDNQALQATQNNASTNHIDARNLYIGTAETLHDPVDIIIANILMGPLISLKDRFYQLLPKNGLLVLSGIFEEQAPLIIEAYHSSFSLVSQEHQNDWSVLVFSRM